MRFHLEDARRHRRVTKALPRLMREGGIDIGHTAAADIAARLFGYVDRHELYACLGRAPASRWDEDEAPAVAAARHARQVGVMEKAGLTPSAAMHLIDALKPTAKAGLRRTVSASATPSPSIRGQSVTTAWAGDVDAVLAEREKLDANGIGAAFARLVGLAYDGCFERLSVGADEREGAFQAVAHHFEETRVVERLSASVGEEMLAWVGGEGSVLQIQHGGLNIPFEVEASSKGSVTGALVRNRRVPAPPLEAYGIDRQAEWVKALLMRPGLHLMCCPDGFGAYLRHGYGRLEESLSATMEGSPVGTVYRRSGMRPTKQLSPEIVDFLLEARGRGAAQSPQSPNSLLFVRDVDAPQGDVIESIDAGKSIMFLASGTPGQVTERLIRSGVPAQWLRQNLLSAGCRCDPPQPHDPASKLGLDEYVAMRWTIDIRHAV